MCAFYLRILIHEFNKFSSSQNTTSDYYIIISNGELLKEVLLFSVAFCICAVSYFISNWQEQHGMKDHVNEYKLFPHFKCSISPSNKNDCSNSKWVLPAAHYRGVSTLYTILFALVFPRLILDVCSVSTCLLHYLPSDSNST